MVVNTHLNDRSPICIRTVNAEDEERLREGIAKLSKRSRYLRFFSGMRELPPVVLEKLLAVDGTDHIAWGAIRSDLPDMPAIGIVHAFRDEDDPMVAEFSVAVVDEYHGQGVARLLTAVLLLDCRGKGFCDLTAHILAENEAAIAFARSLGGLHQSAANGVVEFEIEIDRALACLRAEGDPSGLASVFDQFSSQQL